MKPQGCQATQQNDEYFCHACGLRWGVSNAEYVPDCQLMPAGSIPRLADKIHRTEPPVPSGIVPDCQRVSASEVLQLADKVRQLSGEISQAQTIIERSFHCPTPPRSSDFQTPGKIYRTEASPPKLPTQTVLPTALHGTYQSRINVLEFELAILRAGIEKAIGILDCNDRAFHGAEAADIVRNAIAIAPTSEEDEDTHPLLSDDW